MIRNLLSLGVIILFATLAFISESATAVKKESSTDFSAHRAYAYLQNIAQKPHPIGSIENQRVRDYLVETLKKEGLEVHIESGYTRTSWKPSYNKMAYIENVVATLKGSDPNAKKIILAGHYDSVMEGPGAADDGYSVACMIETARLLKTSNRKHDLVLLITDGEEYGLLGAQYHVENNEMDDVALVLNYEARGAEGPGIAFEWSDNNAWLVDEMSKCYERPIANSLSYEIYKRMPNGSDFSEFQLKNIPGINHAFIDGFSYYHHPQDDLNNISMESVQHTGENMYLAAKHFTNFDFEKQKEGNATFFNFYGRLINYGDDLTMFLFILSLLFSSIAIIQLNKRKEASTKKSLYAFLGLLGTLILAGGLCFGLSTLAKAIYPQYSTFYSYHYYNHEWYLPAGIGLTLIIASILGRYFIKKLGTGNLAVASMLLLSILSLVIYLNASSGTYIMMYPLLFLSLGLIGQHFVNRENKPWLHWAIGIISLVFILGFWTRISHSIYLAFSLNALAGAIIPSALFGFASMGLLPSLWKDKKVIPILGITLFLGSILIAHLKSKPTEDKPLKSNLFYIYESETGQSYAATFDNFINPGHLGVLDNASNGRLDKHLPYSDFYKETETDLSSFRSSIKSDSISNESRSTKWLQHPKHASMIHIYIKDISNIDSLIVDGQLNKDFKTGASGSFYSPMFGIGLDSLEVTVVKRDVNQDAPIYLSTQYQETPSKETLPKNMVRNKGCVFICENLLF